MVGYNVQTADDIRNYLIVDHEATNVSHDRNRLTNMAEQAKAAIGTSELNAVADRGYFSGEGIRKCHEAGITAFVPKCLTSGAKAAGRFDKADFIYHAENNKHQYPADQRPIWRYRTVEHDMMLHCYWSSSCKDCAIRSPCTAGEQRHKKRWEHEAILDAIQIRLDKVPDRMRIRRQTVEHPDQMLGDIDDTLETQVESRVE
jgi:hypothetical protein